MSWISINDELPNAGKRVLVWDSIDKKIKIDEIYVCRNNKNGYEWLSAQINDYQNIKFWMPLPTEPE